MRINALGNTATDFANDDYLALDGTTNGSRKMKNDSLLKVTAQNALTDNVASAFDPTRTNVNPYKAGESVTYEGKTYTFKVDHYGAWVDAEVYPLTTSSFGKAIDNITKVGNQTIVSSTLFGFTPDFGSGKFLSSTRYNSYIFDLGAGVVVENINVNGFVGSVQTDCSPKVDDYFAEGKRVKNVTMKHRYLIVSVDTYATQTTCSISIKYVTPFANKEAFEKEIGYTNKTFENGPLENIVPNISNAVIVSSSLSYNSYVFDIGEGTEYEVLFSGNAFYLSAQTDIIPKIGDPVYCGNRNPSGFMFHRYLIVCIAMSEPDLNIQIKTLGRGISFNTKEIQKVTPVSCKILYSDLLDGIIPDSNNYAAASATYDSFVFDVGKGKNFNINVYGAVFFCALQEDSIPSVGSPRTSIAYRVTEGIMTKRYLIVCVNKLNKSGIGCVVSILGEGRKKIKALFIGNSVNQDHVMYAPWFLYNEYKKELVFEIGNFYIASYTIKAYVENCVNGSRTADIYSTAYGTPTWTNVENTELLEDAIESNDWDIICVQGYYNNGALGPEDMSYLADLVQFISDHATKPFTLAFMMHQTYTTGALTRIIDGTKYSVENSSVRLIFPCGLATEFVKGEWLQSFLTSDNIHNQEGLPCILGGYVVGDVLARFVGLPSRVMGNKKRMTSQEHDYLNIAGQNGTFQAGTNTQFDQAQIAACKAVNAGYGVLETAQQEMIPHE